MKVRELLQYTADLYGMDCKTKMKELADRLNLDLSRKIADLSLGNKKKVGIVSAIMTSPKLLIMDEPTRGIDVGAKHEIYEIMCDLAKQGKAIIMISSEMSELLGMSDRICVMCNGKLTGEVKEPEDMTQAKIMEYATRF